MEVSMNKVHVWEEKVIIPTYEAGKPDKNPVFLEKRVYQGSSGRIYPHTVIEKISNKKVNKEYTALFLENDYLKVMMLPELGGRIQRAYDKTNGYDFIYYNHVIKPALVGLAGPWISGGIEFNWPQHHRPSTFDPVEYTYTENEDGSATVWMGEIENMFRTEGVLGVTLYPDKAYIELSAKLYNRTKMPQTFLWWANPAVAVNDDTISVFPEDVTAVYDHGKRDVISFPYAEGTYYKHKYDHVNIAQYKNIPVPTSYMAYRSDYNFIGEYDYGKQAGLLHVANHHIAPGKKQWTWGCGEFGKAWDRALTDEDGPYIELMTGCFTDNQPDFTWIQPQETKNFKQYFMPYKNIGYVKNATIDAAVNAVVDVEKKELKILAYATSEQPKACVRVTKQDGKSGQEKVLYEGKTDLSPTHTCEIAVSVDCVFEKCDIAEASETMQAEKNAGNEGMQRDAKYNSVTNSDADVDKNGKFSGIKISILAVDGRELVSYRFPEKIDAEVPEPAKAAPLPKDCKTTEDLFLYGLHVEQYRHATYCPEDYYLEGLRLDPTDIRLNNAYGRCLLKACDFAGAEGYFRKAVEKSIRSNPNPYDYEPYYNLGLSLKYQGRGKEAYDAFYKAVWGGAFQAPGFYELACLDAKNGDWKEALEHINESILRQYHCMKAQALKELILRKLGREEAAENLRKESIQIDPLYDRQPEKINHNTLIELVIDLYEAGQYPLGIALAEKWVEYRKEITGSSEADIYPLVYYYIAYGYSKIVDADKKATCRTEKNKKCEEYICLAETAAADGCFPHRIEDYIVLKTLAEEFDLGMAYYYLGCLLYDKRVYDAAVEDYEKSARKYPDFPTVHRNLALAYYNVYRQPEKAYEEMSLAFTLDETDARVYLELDQLRKRMNVPIQERLKDMEQHLALVENRDDLYLEYVTLLNTLGENARALGLIEKRHFHQWEGGEGKVAAQYLTALYRLAKAAVAEEHYAEARELLLRAVGEYPYNLGEGKLESAQENNLYYLLGLVYEKLGEEEAARDCYTKAGCGESEPVGMMYYNDQPPEMIYYQGLAHLQLRNTEEAHLRFQKLVDYGRQHLEDVVKTDYFAVSLPDLLIFEEDLSERNRKHCLFMMSLGLRGLGREAEADACTKQLLAMDNAHQGIRIHGEAEGI